MVRSARDAGVVVDLVNVMAMDYYRAGDYGTFAVQAAQGDLRPDPGPLPERVGRHRLADGRHHANARGQNDDGAGLRPGRCPATGDLRPAEPCRDARVLGDDPRSQRCQPRALYMCTNIAQQPYEFSRIFAGYTG